MKNHFKTWCKIGNTLGVTGKKKKIRTKRFGKVTLSSQTVTFSKTLSTSHHSLIKNT